MSVSNNPIDLVFLHGWGMNASVWDASCRQLEKQHRLYNLDLPGYGQNKWLPQRYDLHGIADWAIDSVPAGAIWIGWSLGGMVALRAAMNRSEHISKLVLIATTPRFLNSHDWSFGIDPESMDTYRLMLDEDYLTMLTNFFLIQAANVKTSRKQVRDFAQQVAERGTPTPGVLENGLNILAESDLRSDLDRLDLPIHLIHGSEDRVVPVNAAKYVSQELANAQLHTMRESGHNLLMSHPDTFMKTLKSCLYE